METKEVTQQNWQDVADALVSQIEANALFRSAMMDAISRVADQRRAQIAELRMEATMKRIHGTNTEGCDFAYEELGKLEQKANVYIVDNLLSVDQNINDYSELISGKTFGQVFPD